MVALVALAAALIPHVLAASTPVKRQAITALSTAQIDAFTPYSNFAAAAYCSGTQTSDWGCGPLCDANSGFEVQASGGDGDGTQFWYVGYDPSLKEVIVAHQGTDPEKILSDLTDATFFLGELDSSLFPGISSSITVHDGFRNEQAKTASDVLAAVKASMSAHGTDSITLVGHSLGAAISLLDSVFLTLNLGSSASIKFIGYGLPRVGNQDFANYLDANIDVTHVNNKEDIVPILPGMFLGYHHPSGEVHIVDSGAWDSCPGQDNESDQCSTGDVPTIFNGDEDDHDGPYNGVMMGTVAADMCT
ncbi:alpha/beta-hydrolase [Peniophora sp. CONT]|nr:alpha/beta-hydrolase [Peniophora sp. CONT]